MISHYFKLAQKTLIKNRYYTFINVFGLTCGMLSVLIIAKFVGYSMEFDNFHLMKDRIYSVTQVESLDGNPQQKRNSTYWGVGELINQFPEVSSITRYSRHVAATVIVEDDKGNSISFVENRIFVTDSSFLTIFTFPLIDGNPKTVLSSPNSIVITSSASQRYFGDTDPLGKTLAIRRPWGKETIYKVTGVLEDIPEFSRFKFEFLITSKFGKRNEQIWDSPDYSIYTLLNDNAQGEELAKKLRTSLRDVAQLKSNNRTLAVSLVPITNIQLSEIEHILVATGIFIALICWVNYINQVIAQSYWRIKEVGMLRVMGATRWNLMAQFIIESTLICMISLILITGIYLGLEQQQQSLTNGHLLPLIGDPTSVNLVFLTVFIIGIVITAAIPTAILYSPNLAMTWRNVNNTKIGGIGLRKALVTIQFSISTVLMICIFVITGQLDFLRTQNKGFNMQNVLVIKTPMVKDTAWNVKRRRLKVFKEKCAELPIIMDVTSSSTVPGDEYRNETYLSLKARDDKFLVHQNGVDDNYFHLYNVEFIAGHDFIPKAKFENQSSIILNESAARGLGIYDFNKAIDAKIVDHGSDKVYTLIGIIKDYHQTPMKYKMAPTAFKFNVFRGHISMKINSAGIRDGALAESINTMELTWNQLYDDAPFDYFFLDERFEALNMEDRYFGKLFEYFTALSIVISCLGLFGLSLFISIKRQKEIGVRKVFGASIFDVLKIFYKGYFGPLLTSVVIGSPLAYLLMNMWLKNYAYRIEIRIETIAMAVLSLTLIFILTISYHIIKSSIANPVTILRD